MNGVTEFEYFKLVGTESRELEIQGVSNSELTNMSCRKTMVGVTRCLKGYIVLDVNAIANSRGCTRFRSQHSSGLRCQ